MQGEIAPSYKAFSMGNALDGATVGSFFGFSSGEDVGGFIDGGGVEKSSMKSYLDNLISLYIDRVKVLMNDPLSLDAALSEIKKVFIRIYKYYLL